MTPSEILFRSVQEASKTIESIRTNPDSVEPPCVFTKLKHDQENSGIVQLYHAGHDSHAVQAMITAFQLTAPARFFAGANEDAVPLLINANCEEQKAVIVEHANAILRREFPILGYGRLSFGTPIDWQLDPLTNRSSPLLHWSKLNPLDTDTVGDHKVVWELNRHQWLLDLGQAYRFTGDERYAAFFAEVLTEWMQANPAGVGLNWSSSLEASLRLMSWCWGLFLFRGSLALTPELQVAMIGWIDVHASYVERYLSRYFSPNTHLTGEALGLYYAGTLLTDLRSAQHWASLGSEILAQQIKQQVYNDGVYFEQATRYQYYTIDIYLHYVILARRNGQKVPAEINAGLQHMLDFMLSVQLPDGAMPQIGDADGGWLLPLVRRDPDDCRALFSTAAVLFKRTDYAWAAGEVAPETLWLLGSHSREIFQSLQPRPPEQIPLRLFRQGGYAVMRDSWQPSAHHLIFDTGPLGCAFTGGHGHADLLSIQCSAFGEPYIVDAGTGSYGTHEQWRQYFRSTHAHSTILIDDRDQAEPKGPFAWQGERPAASLLRYVTDDQHDIVDAAHDAYRNLADPVVHRRRVMYVKAGTGFWVVIDDLTGAARHKVDLRYQLAHLDVSNDESWTRVRGLLGSALLIRAFAPVSLDAQLISGQQEPPTGWLSADYGKHEPAPMLSYVTETALPLRIVTLLYPLANADAAAPAVAATINAYEPSTVTATAGYSQSYTQTGAQQVSKSPDTRNADELVVITNGREYRIRIDDQTVTIAD
ncbi:MAG: alginate lyase family protein [Pseudomonadota bacterium]